MKAHLLVISIIFLSLSAMAQTGSITGRIQSDKGQPLPFVSVGLKGTSFGSATGDEGKFRRGNVPAGNHMLVVTSIGYNSVSQAVTVYPNETTSVEILLTESTEQLQAVEITGRKERTYKNTWSFSGTKTETPLRYVPQAISYVTKEVMDDQQAFKTSDVLKNLSGVNVFSFYNNDFSLRGFRASNALINGLRDPTNSWSQSLLPNVERLEVIKGP